MSPDTPTRPRAALATPAVGGEPRWQVRLLGAVEASDGAQCITRFPSRAVAALLARLALAPERSHAREELVELLWPGVSLTVGRNRLRQALSTLKSLLEPPGQPGAAVLAADRVSVRVVPGALGCDARRFEWLLRSGRPAEAHAVYGGELMPGYYDDWIDQERHRLATLHERLPVPVSLPAAAAAPAIEPAPHPAASATGAAGLAVVATLPAYLTRLFGAELPAARLRAQVLAHRLVTVLGAGGSGKTRLAVEVAQDLRAHPPWVDGASGAAMRFDRVAFVPLVACVDGPQLLQAVMRALQLPSQPAPGPDEDAGLGVVVAALAGQRLLLVLDNFEQLVGRAETRVAALLERLPALHLLVTSRRALGLDGECCAAAEPLPLPAATADLATAAANPAVALFVDRARAVRADFHLGERNATAIVALVRRLHGMPLAIELAASRVRSFTPAEMVSMLGPGGAQLPLLARTGARAGHDARHASMAEVIDWSWRLLDAPAQMLVCALTLFPADAPVAAVAASLDRGAVATAAALDELVAQSLLRPVPPTGSAGPRFALLEPVREFAAQRWPPGAAAAARSRLRRWLVDWAGAAGVATAPAAVTPELPLVRAVLADAAAPGAAHDALRLAVALRPYWDSDMLPGSVLDALEQGLATLDPAADPALLTDAHELLAALRYEAGYRRQAGAHAEAAVQTAGADPVRRGRALLRRAWIVVAIGRDADPAAPHYEALRADLQEALDLARAAGDRDTQARALHQMAVILTLTRGDWAGAERLLAQAQALWLALGDRRQAYARMRNQAQCWLRMGRADQAQACFEQCEQAAREGGDWLGQVDNLISLAALQGDRRQWAGSLQLGQRCVALCWQRWNRHGLAYGLWNLPRPLARLRRPEPALRLMAFAAAFWEAGFGALSGDDLKYVRRVRRLATVQLGAARAQALWLQGATMQLSDAVALALEA